MDLRGTWHEHINGELGPIEGIRGIAKKMPCDGGPIQGMSRGRQPHGVFHQRTRDGICKGKVSPIHSHVRIIKVFFIHTTASVCVEKKENIAYPKIHLGFLPTLVHLLSLGSGRRLPPWQTSRSSLCPPSRQQQEFRIQQQREQKQSDLDSRKQDITLPMVIFLDLRAYGQRSRRTRA